MQAAVCRDRIKPQYVLAALGVKQTRSGLAVELGCDGGVKEGEKVAFLFPAGSIADHIRSW